MARRKKSTLLAQRKERRLDGTGWPWRVRLYAPGASRGGTTPCRLEDELFFDLGYVHVNGSWITPRGQAGFRCTRCHCPSR